MKFLVPVLPRRFKTSFVSGCGTIKFQINTILIKECFEKEFVTEALVHLDLFISPFEAQLRIIFFLSFWKKTAKKKMKLTADK